MRDFHEVYREKKEKRKIISKRVLAFSRGLWYSPFQQGDDGKKYACGALREQPVGARLWESRPNTFPSFLPNGMAQ